MHYFASYFDVDREANNQFLAFLDRGSSQAARRRPGRPERPPDGERHPHLGAQLWAVAAAEHGLDHDAVADRQEHDHQRLLQG